MKGMADTFDSKGLHNYDCIDISNKICYIIVIINLLSDKYNWYTIYHTSIIYNIEIQLQIK